MGIVPTDDLISLLAQDHEAIKERFSELGHADPEVRGQLFWELTEQLVRHEVAEEVVVYPALRQEPGGDAVAEARALEESEAERLLARLEKLDPMTEEFRGTIRDLEAAVLDHAQKEEAEVFPLLAANEERGYLSLLGQKFKGEKLGAPTHPHPHTPDSPVAQKVVGPVAALIDRIRDGSRRRGA
jgi:iron-sulfur cluster repair protein YtfE (RIC family)